MGLESFGKKAKNAVRAAVLGSSLLAAAPATEASAREVWPMPPAPASDAMQQIERNTQALEANTKQTMDAFDAQAKALDESAKRQMDTFDAQAKALDENAKQTMDELDAQARAISQSGHDKMEQFHREFEEREKQKGSNE